MARPVIKLPKSTNRALQKILTQVERVRVLCDRIESEVWDAVGAPKKRKRLH